MVSVKGNINLTQDQMNQIREIFRTELDSVLGRFIPINDKTNDILSLSEAAKFIGVKRSQMYQLNNQHAIPFTKPGKKLVYYRKQDLLDYLTHNRKQSSDEMESAVATYIAVSKLKK